MKLMCWNSSGLGNQRGVRALHDLTHLEDPDVLFLLETKLLSKKLDAIESRIGFHACIGVDSEGRAGSLSCGKIKLISSYATSLDTMCMYLLSPSKDHHGSLPFFTITQRQHDGRNPSISREPSNLRTVSLGLWEGTLMRL